MARAHLLQLRDGDDVARARPRARRRAPRRACASACRGARARRSSRSGSSESCVHACPRPDAQQRERAGVAVDDGLEDEGGEGRPRVGARARARRRRRGRAPRARGARRARAATRPSRAEQRRDALQRGRRAAQHGERSARRARRRRGPARPPRRRACLPPGTSRSARRRSRPPPRRCGRAPPTAAARSASGTGPSPSGRTRHAAQHVDHALEAALGADRERDEPRAARPRARPRVASAARRDRRAPCPCRSRTRRREAQPAGRAPHRVGADLHAVHRRDDQHGGVEGGEADLALARGSSRRPACRPGSTAWPRVVEAEDVGGERVAALLLLGPVVEERAAVVDAAQRLGRAGGVQQRPRPRRSCRPPRVRSGQSSFGCRHPSSAMGSLLLARPLPLGAVLLEEQPQALEGEEGLDALDATASRWR